jgi:hypothetical protein
MTFEESECEIQQSRNWSRNEILCLIDAYVKHRN